MKTSWYRKLFLPAPVADLQAIRARAEAGDVEAQFDLAVACGSNTASPADLSSAAEWYRKAAEQSHAQAQFAFGILCAEGRGVPRDDAEALRWLRKAAQQGQVEALLNLGIRCLRATFGPRPTDASESRIEAYKWLRLAANQGSQTSIAAWEQVAMAMTPEEVAEGNHRTRQFAVCPAGSLVSG